MSTVQPQNNIRKWADHAVLSMQPPYDEPQDGLFFVTFNNSKKRGKMRALQSYDAWGYCFAETGHVTLDTTHLPVKGFESMGQMREYLGKLGMYRVVSQQKNEDEG